MSLQYKNNTQNLSDNPFLIYYFFIFIKRVDLQYSFL